MDIKWLFASDIHFPKHDPRMVALWMDVLKYLKPQAVDLLGDIDDADSTSRWAEGTSRAGTSLEDAGVADTRRFLEDIHSVVPKADKHFHDGNHGWYRHAKFLDKNAPQVLDYITPDTLYEYNKSKFEWHLYDQPPVKRYGDIYAHHGEAISMHSGESVKKDVHSFGVSMIRGHCFSADTEILSDRGWLGYQEVSVGDTVYTMNQASGLGEWQQVTEKFVYSDFTEMVSIKSTVVDLLVTAGHGMIEKSGSGYKTLTAGDFVGTKKRHVLPQGVPSSSSLDATDSEIRMMAWIIAEGNFDWYQTVSGPRFRVRLSQSDGPDGRLQRLEGLFGELGWKWSPIQRYAANTNVHGTWRNYDAYRINIRREDCKDFVSSFLTEGKQLRDEVCSAMSARQAALFLEEYVWADGCKNPSAVNSYQLASNDEKTVGHLQALSVMAGFRCTVSGPNKGVWYITYNTRGQTEVRRGHVEVVEYSGDVWCVTVPNHTVVVRRNGKSVVTMNSHRQGEYHVAYPLAGRELRGFEIGHMCDPKQMTYDTAPNWQAGFAYGLVHGDDVFIDTVEIKNYACYVAGKLFKG